LRSAGNSETGMSNADMTNDACVWFGLVWFS
jgi:hypothetical protein